MKKLAWPAVVLAAAIILVGTWGSTIRASATDTQIQVVTAGAAKAADSGKPKTVASSNLHQRKKRER